MMRIKEIFDKRRKEQQQAEIAARGKLLYGAPGKYVRRKKWYAKAHYIYEMMPNEQGEYLITFIFPHSFSGPLDFTTWLYKETDTGQLTNLAAEMLQCYIDEEEIR